MLLRYRDEAQKQFMQRHYASFNRIARCQCGNQALSNYLKLFEPCRFVEQPNEKHDLWVSCDACRARRVVVQ